jgi:hypothetical protein
MRRRRPDDEGCYPLIRRGSLPWLSFATTRPASFFMTSSVRLFSASWRARPTASLFRSCNESARCVPSVWTAQRPPGRGSTATCGLRAMSAPVGLRYLATVTMIQTCCKRHRSRVTGVGNDRQYWRILKCFLGLQGRRRGIETESSQTKDRAGV